LAIDNILIQNNELGLKLMTLELCLQKTPLQQCLHIATAIGNHHNVNIFGHDPVDDAVGFEKNLTVLAKPDCQ